MIIDTAEPRTCRSCSATVYWRVEKSGKRNPYNAPEPCRQCGNINADCLKCEGTGEMQISHFATCKDAQKWRKQ